MVARHAVRAENRRRGMVTLPVVAGLLRRWIDRLHDYLVQPWR